MRQRNNVDIFTILDCFGNRTIKLFSIYEEHLTDPNRPIKNNIVNFFVRVRGVSLGER